MTEIERRTQDARRRASRNGRRVTDPATPTVGNQRRALESPWELGREPEPSPADTPSRGIAATSTISASDK